MKCDLSQVDDQMALDLVVARFGSEVEHINIFLLDGFFLMTGQFASPVSGRAFDEEHVQQWLAKTTIEDVLQKAIRERPTKANEKAVWNPETLKYVRMSFWSFMMNRLTLLVMTNGISLMELWYLTKHVLYGGLRECPTQTMHDLVSMRYLLQQHKESEPYNNFFEVAYLFDTCKMILHSLLTAPMSETLELVVSHDSPQEIYVPDVFINQLVAQYVQFDAMNLIIA